MSNSEHIWLLFQKGLIRVDVGNVSKKDKNMKGIITWSIFTKWFFNQTLSMYVHAQLITKNYVL